MTLFYDASVELNVKEFIFNKEESKHLAKVLRMSIGDIISVTNGMGLEWIGKLSLVTPYKVIAKLKDSVKHQKNKNQIHLVIAPTKNNNRMEWLLEKITELGVASITFISCDNSERKIIKKKRFEKIIISGLKQSQQFFLPKINEIISFKEFITTHESDQTFIAHCEDQPKQKLFDIKLTGSEISLMIGPEGDFSTSEINFAIERNIVPVSLGKQRFRTETAGILGCHSLLIKQQQNTIL